MSTPMSDRYDRIADGYRHWAVVLHPGGERLLDRLEALLPGLCAGEAARVLDLGCGTGSQLLAAAQRWPGARLTGLDASAGMLSHARAGAERLPKPVRDRIELVHADAARLPFGPASFDVVVTAFVLQLVPARPPVLAELHRVVASGGVVGVDGWVEARDELAFEPEEAFEESLDDLGIARSPNEDHRAGDFASAASAAREFRRAGFRRVSARPDTLDHLWTPESYAAYKRESRERDLYESLDPKTADRLAAVFRARLDRIHASNPEAFRFRPPIVSLVAIRP